MHKLDWRLSNTDSDFDQWRRCAKCHEELVVPKTMPCLHTACLTCLVAHNDLEYKKFRRQYPNVDTGKYMMPCPFCCFPCHLPRGPAELKTNQWLLRIVYRERIAWWREFVNNKDKWVTSFELEKRRLCKETAKQAKKRSWSKQGKADERKPLLSGAGASAEGQGSSVEVEGACAEAQGESGVQQLFDSQSHIYHWPWEDKLNPEIRRVLRTNLIEHHSSLQQQCLEPLDDDVDLQLPGAGKVRHLFNFDLSFGSDPPQCLRACNIAVNKETGNVMVVDTSLGKGIFYHEDGTYLGQKYFKHPVLDCAFLSVKEEFPMERFCAIGMRKGDYDNPAMLFVGPVNDDPNIYNEFQQTVLGDVTGFHIVNDVYYISMGNENRAIWKFRERTFVDICPKGKLKYPTNITNGVNNDIIIADTGHHRIAVFSGSKYNNLQFFGKFGHNEGDLYWPLGVAVDKFGRIYVCDTNNYRVQVFNSEYEYECMPIKNTFRITSSVAQDVKPIDCAIDCQQRLLVLFRGKSYTSLQCFAYDHPAWCNYPSDESPKRGLCCRCLCCCCCRNSRNRSDYQRI